MHTDTYTKHRLVLAISETPLKLPSDRHPRVSSFPRLARRDAHRAMVSLLRWFRRALPLAAVARATRAFSRGRAADPADRPGACDRRRADEVHAGARRPGHGHIFCNRCMWPAAKPSTGVGRERGVTLSPLCVLLWQRYSPQTRHNTFVFRFKAQWRRHAALNTRKHESSENHKTSVRKSTTTTTNSDSEYSESLSIT